MNKNSVKVPLSYKKSYEFAWEVLWIPTLCLMFESLGRSVRKIFIVKKDYGDLTYFDLTGWGKEREKERKKEREYEIKNEQEREREKAYKRLREREREGGRDRDICREGKNRDTLCFLFLAL